jgi:D-amino peptidase
VKIYISCDMEGTSGVVSWDQCLKDRPEFERARYLLLGDVNAAVEGALAAGADEVIVADMHDGSLILPTEGLHPGAKYVVGVPHISPRFPYLEDSFDAMFLVAYHAMAETSPAVLAHTMSSEWFEYAVNGTPVGEVEIDAALAGAAGVPVTLVTGDQAVCAEARRFLGEIETVEVKQATDYARALCLAPMTSHQLIREAAERAAKIGKKVKRFGFGTPVEITVKMRDQRAVPRGDGKATFNPDPFTIGYRYKRFEEHYGGTWKGRK